MNELYIYWVACFSAIGGFLFGYDTGIMSSVLEMKDFIAIFGPNSWQKGFIVGGFQLGAAIGAFFSNFIADLKGRRIGIASGCIVFIVGAVIQTASFRLGPLYVGRIIAGIAIGILSMVIPIYQSELAPKKIRGKLVSLQQLAITFGILISFWLGYIVIQTNMFNGWRMMMGLQILPAIALLSGILFLPESPRWYIDRRNDETNARISLLRLRRKDASVEDELQEIIQGVKLENQLGKARWRDLFRKPIIYPLSIGVFIEIFQQLTGINAIMYYAPSIFQSVATVTVSNLAQGITGIVNFISTFPAIYLVDRIGRKKLLITGALGMTVCFVIVTGLFGGFSTTDNNNNVIFNNTVAGWVAIIFIYLFVVNFAYSWGPVGWILPAEIYPLKYRARAFSIVVAVNWLANLIVSQFTPVLLQVIHFFLFLIFIGALLIMTIYVYYFVPETKGKSLEEIETYFLTKSQLIQPKSLEKDTDIELTNAPLYTKQDLEPSIDHV